MTIGYVLHPLVKLYVLLSVNNFICPENGWYSFRTVTSPKPPLITSDQIFHQISAALNLSTTLSRYTKEKTIFNETVANTSGNLTDLINEVNSTLAEYFKQAQERDIKSLAEKMSREREDIQKLKDQLESKNVRLQEQEDNLKQRQDEVLSKEEKLATEKNNIEEVKQNLNDRNMTLVRDEATLATNKTVWDQSLKERREKLEKDEEDIQKRIDKFNENKAKYYSDTKEVEKMKRDLASKNGSLVEQEKQLTARKCKMDIKESKLSEQEKQLNRSQATFHENQRVRKDHLDREESELSKREELYRKNVDNWNLEMEKERKRWKTFMDYAMVVLGAAGVIIGLLVIIVCLLQRPVKVEGRSSLPQKKAAASSNAATSLDICHLTLTRERNIFFNSTLLPKLKELHIHPETQCRVLQKPSDFDDIPAARCYMVHWTSQRMSIFTRKWCHAGLLRALGNSPVMILVYDSERMETLPNGEIFDSTFQQIETEQELKDAARENRLITYRANEAFNDSQYQALKNWVNANITGPF